MAWRTILFLAWRNLWRNRRRTIITASTISLGFAMAVVSIGLGDGSHNQMIRNAIRLGDGHLTIQPKGYLETPGNHLYLKNSEALLTHPALIRMRATVAPRIILQVLASTAHNSLGAGLQGIEAARDPYARILGEHLTAGNWIEAGDERGIVIGSKMAEKLKARVGSKVVILAGGERGELEARLGRVRGIFSSGIDDLDGFTLLGDLAFTRPLLPGYRAERDPSPVTRLAIFLEEPDETAMWREALKAQPLPFEAVVLDWQEMMPHVVNFIALDDAGNYVFLAIILVVVVIGILNTVLMSVLERTREFGMVRALGMRPRQLLALVVAETTLLALVALAAGWVVGGMAHLYFAVFGLDLSALSPELLTTAGITIDPVIKSELSLNRIAALTLLVFGATLLSGIYPAIKAARVYPIAALRT